MPPPPTLQERRQALHSAQDAPYSLLQDALLPTPYPLPPDLQELGGLPRGSERAAANGAGREEIDAALRTEKETREKLLREKDAELEELRALLRSKPARDPAVGTGPAPALAPAPAEDRTLADAVWPPGWVE